MAKHKKTGKEPTKQHCYTLKHPLLWYSALRPPVPRAKEVRKVAEK